MLLFTNGDWGAFEYWFLAFSNVNYERMNIKRSLSYTGGVIVVLLVLALITITLLPITIKWQVNNWFEEQGLVSQVKDVELNLT